MLHTSILITYILDKLKFQSSIAAGASRISHRELKKLKFYKIMLSSDAKRLSDDLSESLLLPISKGVTLNYNLLLIHIILL